jgi:hypothetical protein
VTVRFWPASEAAQADYEQLRGVAFSGGVSIGLAARRFDQRGLAGLIAWPASEPLFVASITGAVRPAWTPHSDPRAESLASSYEFLLGFATETISVVREARQ